MVDLKPDVDKKMEDQLNDLHFVQFGVLTLSCIFFLVKRCTKDVLKPE
jgi:hypothetical protein